MDTETRSLSLAEKESSDAQDAFYKLESIIRIARQKCEENGESQDLEDVGALMEMAQEKLKTIKNILTE